ncbi:MAG TPA: AMP-binding protein [Xanthobacteraceae bacterium]|nr:AMP-binding protein [Xanthobacteraceae bacterium]
MNSMLTLLTDELIKKYYSAGFWRDDTIYSLVRGHAERTPASFALRDRFRRITYRELAAAADALAADLASRGVAPGQRVSVWLPSRMEGVIALLACSRNGYLCCPSLHRDHTVGEVIELLQRTRSAAFIGQEGFGADAPRRDIFAELSSLAFMRHVYRLSPLIPSPARETCGGEGRRETPGWAALLSPIPDSSPPLRSASRWEGKNVDVAPKQDPNQIVYLAFTSGTTGKPKGVMHSDNTLLANACQLAKDWSIGADSVVYSLSPLSHNLGFGAQVMALAVGGELVVNDLPKGASLVDRILETGTTFLVGVPAHAGDLLSEMRTRGLNGLGRLKGFRISGAAAPRAVVAGLLERGIIPQSGYGMTETCSHQYTLPNDDATRIVETSGRACPGYELRIFKADDRDTPAPPGEIGQIGGRGASLMLGYFDDQAATEDAFNKDGWFMTGDLGLLDADGYLRITGRLKDIIIRGGHNIHPARIEALAMRHAAIARAAAVPIADARLGEKVCLAVMFHSGKHVAPAELLAHLDAAGLSRYDMPEYFVSLDEIPLTPNGKIRKRDIVDWIAKGRISPEPVRWQAKQATA